jgi:hypothetical protein
MLDRCGPVVTALTGIDVEIFPSEEPVQSGFTVEFSVYLRVLGLYRTQCLPLSQCALENSRT